MIKLLRKLATVMLPAFLCGTLLIGCEADDKYTKVDDLFQPRFVLEKPEVKANSVTLVWYKVNDATSYTVQLHQDQYYTSLFMEIETTDPYVFIDDIPYGTTFYIRVRSNAAKTINNSQWSYVSASTEARPEYAKLVEDVSKTEITESSAIIRWKKDNKQNPVDSISIMPMMDTTLPGVSRYLTIEEMMQGYAEVDGLTKNTLYAVNLYDTSKPRKYDKPYNQVTFRTAGPSAMSIQVGLEDDLSAMLLDNDVDPEVPEGTEYYLPAGSSYRVTPFSLMKGFRLAGSRDGVKPVVVLEGSWSIAEGSYLSSLEFDNIEFRHEANNNYFMNTSKAYTIENVSFVNCDFISLRRGFWRHQSANAKYIMNLEMEGCRFEGCGWQTSAYGAFNLQSFDKDNGVSYDQVDRAIFRNCTFSNDNDGTNGYGWGNLFYAPYMDKPIDLEYKNVTIYNYSRNQRLINIESAVGSKLVMEGISANSTAFLEEEVPGEKPKGVGNPTEVALLLWLNSQGCDYLALREKATVIDQLTFSTERKFMATLVQFPLIGKKVLYVKGAPEIVLGKCKEVMLDGRRVDAVEYRSTVEAQLLNYQNMAMRTLGFAFKIVDDAEASDCVSLVAENDLSFLGVVAISDPIRPDVPAAVSKCQSAAIAVKTATGATQGTATEIARQIGLWKPEDTEKNRITGAAFAELTDEEALDRVMDLKIMSRARPTDKQRLVQLLQQKGAVVAVTGDGTNDAPALNHAQVGLSMGTGTSVAKEASDITLLDDSFNSIGTAVMWGRSLYKNIQRFIVFQLTINFVALFIVLLGSLVGTTLPLTVTQMLWVNLIMDTFAALALASIPPSESVMKEKPRKSTDFIITKSMRYYILGMGTAFLVLLMGMLFWFNSEEGGMTTYRLTVFFTFFVMLQFWNLFNARVFGTSDSAFKGISKSYGMELIILAILGGQILIVQFGGAVFRTVPLDFMTWMTIVVSTSFVLWIGELVRLIRRLTQK